MHTETLPLDETDCFSQFFLDYINKKESLTPFYGAFPEIGNFEGVIKKRNFPKECRSVLVEVLKKQYQPLEYSSKVLQNIEALGYDKTFTVTTGHQLNIFTGPLYFIYKIVTVINACKSLKQAYSDYEFVPVYWMASEDHDFEEINHCYFEGKKFSWNTDQKGAVGRFDPSGLIEIARQLPSGAQFFNEAYSEKTLAEATRKYVNHLFGDEGLVVVEADDPKLKEQFQHVIEDDLFIHTAEDLVSKTSSSLESQGFKTQVHARQINFFYLENGLRERIEKTEDGFVVLNSDISFSNEEMSARIKSNPEQFSPNVILRPLYQETILPNLAYVGGPSEAVYWLQLKAVFDHFHTAFPMLMPRNFALVIPQNIQKKWDKTGLQTKDIFLSSDDALKKWINVNANHALSYEQELQKLKVVESELKEKSHKIDPTLAQHIEALNSTFQKKLAKAEKKLLRAEKRKHEDKRQQIASVKEELFPNGSLQERHDNFLNFFVKDPKFIQKVLSSFDPFNYKMYLLHI